MTTDKPTFQSRWGHHPCDYELFLKLKRLHKAYWQTVYDFHRWHRWLGKQEHNRIAPEPTYCHLFIEDKVWWKPFHRRGVHGFKIYPRAVVDHGIVSLYGSARRPEPQPVPVFDAETCRRIETLYASLLS
jgi:hypothetical protein